MSISNLDAYVTCNAMRTRAQHLPEELHTVALVNLRALVPIMYSEQTHRTWAHTPKNSTKRADNHQVLGYLRHTCTRLKICFDSIGKETRVSRSMIKQTVQ